MVQDSKQSKRISILESIAKLSIPQEEQASAEGSDKEAKLEANDLERKAQLKRYTAKTDLIEKYAKRLFWFMVGWAGLVILILFFAGGVFDAFFFFYLPEKVLITLVGATTIQVIGLFASVAYYLYKSDKD